jgi:hypothetical protein
MCYFLSLNNCSKTKTITKIVLFKLQNKDFLDYFTHFLPKIPFLFYKKTNFDPEKNLTCDILLK